MWNTYLLPDCIHITLYVKWLKEKKVCWEREKKNPFTNYPYVQFNTDIPSWDGTFTCRNCSGQKYYWHCMSMSWPLQSEILKIKQHTYHLKWFNHVNIQALPAGILYLYYKLYWTKQTLQIPVIYECIYKSHAKESYLLSKLFAFISHCLKSLGPWFM